jgi:hypothetical protein
MQRIRENITRAIIIIINSICIKFNGFKINVTIFSNFVGWSEKFSALTVDTFPKQGFLKNYLIWLLYIVSYDAS